MYVNYWTIRPVVTMKTKFKREKQDNLERERWRCDEIGNLSCFYKSLFLRLKIFLFITFKYSPISNFIIFIKIRSFFLLEKK